MIAELRAIVGRGQRRLLLRYLLATAAYSLSEGVAFGLVAPLLDALLRGNTATAARWLLPLGGAVVVGWIAQYVMGLCALRLASAWRRTLYERIGEQVVRLPLGWFDDDQTGRVPQLVGRDVARVSGIVFLTQALIGALLTPATILVFLLVLDWRIALPVLVVVPVVLVMFAVARRITDRTEAAHDAAAAEAGARLLEFAIAQPTLRSTRRSRAGRQGLDDALDAQHAAARREVLGALPSQYLGQLAVQLAFTAVLVAGLLLATHTSMSPSRAVALIVLGVSFVRPFELVAGVTTSLRASRASVGRVAAFLAVAPLPEPARPQPIGAPSMGAPIGAPSIELDAVRFGYGEGPPVLDGATLHVPPGGTVALVGASGAGKTTVTKLVARFFDVDAGSVRVGGVDVREVASADLMSCLSLVFQNVYLLDATIEDNIRFGNPSATDSQVREAARRARVDPIVHRLPGGWDTRVGEGGRLLSGGERQRVAIARALCKDAPIVLLDEATSSLDAENEAAVQAALAELGAGRTMLVIAHRLSTITHADRIAVLDGGRVVELGRHEELLNADGRYAAFWRERQRAAGWRLVRP